MNIAPPHLLPVLQALDAERRDTFAQGVAGEVLPKVTRVHGIAGDWHQIAFSALTAEDADAVIAEQVAHYRRLGVGVEWTVYRHDAPRDLLLRLSAHGFQVGPREAVLVLDLRTRRDWLAAACPHRVERVQSAPGLSDFAATAERIFGVDQTPVLRELEARLAEHSSGHVAYLVYDGDEIAAVGRLQLDPGCQFARLYGGGTLDAHRGRGLYGAAVQRRAQDAAAFGARYLRVDALPTSQPILEKMGFEVLSYSWPCVLGE